MYPTAASSTVVTLAATMRLYRAYAGTNSNITRLAKKAPNKNFDAFYNIIRIKTGLLFFCQFVTTSYSATSQQKQNSGFNLIQAFHHLFFQLFLKGQQLIEDRLILAAQDLRSKDACILRGIYRHSCHRHPVRHLHNRQ